MALAGTGTQVHGMAAYLTCMDGNRPPDTCEHKSLVNSRIQRQAWNILRDWSTRTA